MSPLSSRPSYSPRMRFVVSPSVRGMTPSFLLIIAIFVVIILALFSVATPSSTMALPAQPANLSKVGQARPLQLPIQALFAPASGQRMSQPMRVVYQLGGPTDTPTPEFTPDPNAPRIFITSQDARFFPNSDEHTCSFATVTTATPPAFTEPKKFPVINFNPELNPGGCGAPVPGPTTRPFTDLIPHTGGTPCATQPAQDHLDATPTLQAGLTPGALFNFHAVFTGQIYVPAAGDVTLNFYVDDAWVLGIGPKIGGSGEQPYYVSGYFDPPTPPPPTPSPVTVFNNYLVVSRLQRASDLGERPTTVHFPSAGYYPIELDYTECEGQKLEMVLGSKAEVPIPNGVTPTTTAVPTVVCDSSSDWCTSISANGIGHNELRGVAVMSQDHIWAVGGYDIDRTTNTGHSLVEFWDNSTWSVRVGGAPGDPDVGILNGIVAVGNNGDMYAIGDTGMLYYTVSTGWSRVSDRHGGNGIAAGAGLVVAVGNSTQGIQLYDGSWHDQSDPLGATLNGVVVMASDDVTAVGYTGTNYPDRRLHIAKWTGGSTWTTVSGPSIDADSYYTGVDRYADHLWAVGSYYYSGDDRYETLTVYADGPAASRNWRSITSPNPSGVDNRLNHVWLDTEGDVWAVGSYWASGDQALIMRWNDTGWAQISNPSPGVSSELLGIATIPGNVAVVTTTWAVGSYKAHSYAPFETLVESIQAPEAVHSNLSYYENDLATVNDLDHFYEQGCLAARRGDSGVIVLDFGQPQNLGSPANPRYGTQLVYGLAVHTAYITNPTPTPTGTPALPIDITNAVERFAKGYHDAYYGVVQIPNCPAVPGPVHSIRLAIGVNNAMNATVVPTTLPTPTVEISGHAQAWAGMIKQIRQDIKSYPEIDVVAAIDAEPDFDTGYVNTRQWAEAYATVDVSAYYDFGATDGYPYVPLGTPTPNVPPFVCSPPTVHCSNWTVDLQYHISYGINAALALPEIYTPQYAREWNRVKRWSIESGQTLHLNFSGVMSECGSAPCGLPPTPTPTPSSIIFDEEQAWRVFWLEINGDPDTRQLLPYATDIKCSNGYYNDECTP
jgi:hypothetical protein